MSNAVGGAARRGLSICNPADQTFRVVDTAFAEIHGYTVEELIGRPVRDLIAPERHGTFEDVAQRAIAAGQLSFESVHVRKDGTRFPVRISIIAATDEEGRIWGAAGVEDLTAPEPGPARISDGRAEYDASLAREKYRLTEREIEVLRLVAAGKTDKDIAKTLGRSPYTVHNHVRHILLKMGASSRTDATVRALREGLV